MKGLFITADDEIVIKVAVAQTKDGTVVSEANVEDLKTVFGDDLTEDSVEEHEVTFRRPNFADTVNMAKDVFNSSDGQNIAFNPWNVRYKRIVTLLKAWSFKDANGKGVPAIPTAVSDLHPSIANTLGVLLDAEIGIL